MVAVVGPFLARTLVSQCNDLPAPIHRGTGKGRDTRLERAVVEAPTWPVPNWVEAFTSFVSQRLGLDEDRPADR